MWHRDTAACFCFLTAVFTLSEALQGKCTGPRDDRFAVVVVAAINQVAGRLVSVGPVSAIAHRRNQSNGFWIVFASARRAFLVSARCAFSSCDCPSRTMLRAMSACARFLAAASTSTDDVDE